MYAISLDAVPKPFSFVKAIITGFMQVEKLEYLSQRPAYKWYSGRDLKTPIVFIKALFYQ